MIQLKYPLILASSSPRRKEILEMAGVSFQVVPSKYEEPLHSSVLSDPESFALDLAFQKGREVFERLEKHNMVLSADTIGVLGHQVLEKPVDRADAKRMLQLLSGKTHEVITAFALFDPDVDTIQDAVRTRVTFRSLTDHEIECYLDQEEYLDKAAAYAIQGLASSFVSRIEGDFFTVVGLPISTIYPLLLQKSN